MKGTSRNPDPFAHGIASINDGTGAEGWYRMFFDNPNYATSENRKKLKGNRGRKIHRNTSISERKVKKAIRYLRKNGEIPSLELAHLTGMESSKIKSALTYRCSIYESDDGRYVGILDEMGDPVPTNHKRKYKINMQTYDVYAFGTVRRFKSMPEIAAYLSISRETATKYYKTGKTTLKKLDGVIIKGVEN